MTPSSRSKDESQRITQTYSSRQNRAIVKAAGDEAKASRDLVLETQIDRLLAARPALSFNWILGPGPNDPPKALGVGNAGTGPALDCYLLRRAHNSLVHISQAFNVPASGSWPTIEISRSVDVGAAMEILHCGRLHLLCSQTFD